MGSLAATILAVTMIAAILLILGGIRLLTQREHRQKGALMLFAAAVLMANVLIWTL